MTTEEAPDPGEEIVAASFRFRWSERLAYVLLASRAGRLFELLAVLFVAIGLLLPPAEPGAALLLGAGVVAALATVLLAANRSLWAGERWVTASRSGLSLQVAAKGVGELSWSSIRYLRRRFGLLLLGVGNGNLVIPLRALGPGDADRLTRLWAAGTGADRVAVAAPADAGEPLLAFRHAPSAGQAVAILARDVAPARGAAAVGLALAVAGAGLLATGQLEIGLALLAGGVVLGTAGWWAVVVALVVGGARDTADAAEITVYRTGYLVSGTLSAWSPWSGFRKARLTPRALVLECANGRPAYVAIGRLNASERRQLESIVAAAGL